MSDVSPQKENGFTGIANELVEALAKTPMSAYESQCLWFIFRKTYGWTKKDDWISLSQFEEATGIKKPHVCRALRLLIEKRIIEKKESDSLPKGAMMISFNKLYSQWRALPKGANTHKALPKGVMGVTERGNQPLPKGAHTKETITKETITKEINICSPQILSELEEFVLWLNRSQIFPNQKTTNAKVKEKWASRRKTFEAKKIAEAFANLVNESDRWKIKNNGHRPLVWWLHSDDRIEEMLACHLKKGKNSLSIISDSYGNFM